MILIMRVCGMVAAVLLASVAVNAADTPEVALRAAIQKEVVDGDLTGAIRLYKGLGQSGNREVAAQALLHMGRCYERLGSLESAKVYQRIVREFADQKGAAQEARDRL